MFQGIHHVALIAGDYQTSKDFYTRILGFRVLAEQFRTERQSHKLDLEIPGGGRLEVFSFPGAPPRPTHPEACGLRHLAFTVKDVAAVKECLEAAGVAVEPVRVDEATGCQFTFFKDPDGLPLEIYET